jgi:integrase
MGDVMPEVDLQAVLLPGGRKTIIERRPLPLPPVRCPLPPPPHKPACDPELSAPSRRWTLREFFERYYVPEKLHGHDCPKSASARKSHRQALDRLRAFCGADPQLDWVTRPGLKRFRRWLGEHCRAASTANRHLRCIVALLREALDESQGVKRSKRLCRPFGKIRLLPEAPKPPRSWRLDELGKMLGAAQGVPGYIGDVAACRWWRALVLVLYDTGLRISAAMALRWSDRKEDSQGVFFVARSETQKTGKEQRLGINAQTVEALAAIGSARELVFFWPWDPSDEYGHRNWCTLRARFLREILGPAGIDPADRQIMHAFRKATATQVKKAGGNATEQLDHSSAAITDRYIDAEELGASRQCDILPRPEEPPGQQLELF